MGGRVTVVIPCYNHAQWLPDAIESALSQTVACDVIVVDDGSTDNTADVATQYPVKLVRKPNGGLPSARNAGIKASLTEWVLPLDADDKLDPTMVEECLNIDADIIAVGQAEFGDSKRVTVFDHSPTFEDFYLANRINCCSLFRKAMWSAIGGYDESMIKGYEDWDFWLRATKAGYNVKSVPRPLFYYRKHGTSLSTTAHAHHNDIVEYMRNKVDNN